MSTNDEGMWRVESCSLCPEENVSRCDMYYLSYCMAYQRKKKSGGAATLQGIHLQTTSNYEALSPEDCVRYDDSTTSLAPSAAGATRLPSLHASARVPQLRRERR